MRRDTSYPATFFITSPPKRSASPLPFSTRVPSTKSRAAPAYGRAGPESPAAIVPPMVAASPCAGGSNASICPRALSAAFTSASGVPPRAESTSSVGS